MSTRSSAIEEPPSSEVNVRLICQSFESSRWRGTLTLSTYCHTPLQNTQRSGDEAHFWLNGYVNKQNFRFWSEANPQVYVETPLHPGKLTVWCALWAGGILLQKR
ncbi:putative DD41D transposase [Trichonephila clavipes]|nr:putative DD41D transposase [Trichonephila clavipes]